MISHETTAKPLNFAMAKPFFIHIGMFDRYAGNDHGEGMMTSVSEDKCQITAIGKTDFNRL